MFLKEMITNVLTMIEEYDPNSLTNFTNDEDIANKIKPAINRKMYELCRIKKIPKYIEMTVTAGDVLDFDTLASECGYDIYQVKLITGVKYDVRGDGTIYKIREDGTAEIDVFVYPDAITEKTSNGYEFELSADVLEIMPYGVAADILSTDVSSNYVEFKNQYERMLSRLDTRNQTPSISIEGGYAI